MNFLKKLSDEDFPDKNVRPREEKNLGGTGVPACGCELFLKSRNQEDGDSTMIGSTRTVRIFGAFRKNREVGQRGLVRVAVVTLSSIRRSFSGGGLSKNLCRAVCPCSRRLQPAADL